MVRDEGEADYRCVNVDCPARLKESVLHFASRKVMNIEGLGEEVRRRVFETSGIRLDWEIKRIGKPLPGLEEAQP